MRIIYPDEVGRELDALFPYVEYRKEIGVVLKEDVSEEIRKRYSDVMKKVAELKRKAY